MLYITVNETEFFDEKSNTFFTKETEVLALEHSLASVSKWEEKWNKPYFSKETKTREESNDYIKCMTINKVDQSVYQRLTMSDIQRINQYINLPMTATTFSEQDIKSKNNVITAEIIYHCMISYNIPFECQYWPFNKLMTLIRVCSIKSNPPKKMGKHERNSRNKAINAARRKQMNTKG